MRLVAREVIRCPDMRFARLSSSLAVLGAALAGVCLGCSERCGGGGACYVCQSDAECTQGKVCADVHVLPSYSGTDGCVSVPGSPCEFELDCASGFCLNGTCAPSPFGARC